LGVPCILGANGLEKIIEVELTQMESEALAESVDSVKDTMRSLEAIR